MPVPRSIDHIVLAVPDLDAAAAGFEAMGFTLTPRAHHPWGTDNRLVQLADQSFLEVLEIARPEKIVEADFSTSPAQFSFGAHNREFLAAKGAGFSMLALTGGDAKADAAAFAAEGMGAYAPFSFGRKARQPDGSEKEVVFELAFAHPACLPELVMFTCHNKFPENFWKPDFQTHKNGATGMMGLTLSSDECDLVAPFLDKLSGSEAERLGPGERWSFGRHWLDLLSSAHREDGTRFSAITLAVQDIDHARTEISLNLPGLKFEASGSGFRLSLPALGDVILAFIEVSE